MVRKYSLGIEILKFELEIKNNAYNSMYKKAFR
jgi:hypothetical protein